MASQPIRLSTIVAIPLVVIVALCPSLQAENIDPEGTGMRWAWSENTGWINAEPMGDGGPGAQVDDFEVTGWMWGENIGWISLSCKNTGICDAVNYGVRNDGNGYLHGFAWGENVGWIDFGPAAAGVIVDVANGLLQGWAWGENVGWIRMSDDSSVNPFGIQSAWTCSPPPEPPGPMLGLVLGREEDHALLTWEGVDGAGGYDVVVGLLSVLRNDPEHFAHATVECPEDNLTRTVHRSFGVPPEGEGVWFLVRATNCGGAGTWDTGQPGQAVPRDEAIAGSGASCPAP